MNIVFLDIDGVLNQLQRNYIDINCVKHLHEIIKLINGKVVLISSWRKGYSNLGKSSPQIEELKQIFNKFGIEIVGRTKDLNNRADEIRDYIKSHEVNKWIILDDDKEEYDKTTDNLYLVNCKTGLTTKDVKQIKKNICK